MDAAEAVDPDLVVEAVHRLDRTLALPFGGEAVGFIQNVAQAEDQLGPPRRLPFEHGQHLAMEAGGFLVHDHHVGAKRFGRAHQGRRAVLDRTRQTRGIAAGIAAVGKLRDRGQAHGAHAAGKGEAVHHGGARDDHRPRAGAGGDEGVGDRPRAPQVAEAKRVVAIDQDAQGGSLAGPGRKGLTVSADVDPIPLPGGTRPIPISPDNRSHIHAAQV